MGLFDLLKNVENAVQSIGDLDGAYEKVSTALKSAETEGKLDESLSDAFHKFDSVYQKGGHKDGADMNIKEMLGFADTLFKAKDKLPDEVQPYVEKLHSALSSIGKA